MQQTHPSPDEVELLLLNAHLRDALEPYLDESVSLVDIEHMSTDEENRFLASMLEWERAPVLSVSQWFQPALVLPPPDSLDTAFLGKVLWETINRLYDQRIILDFTEHLSDRELYLILYRDILPSPEKKLDGPREYLHWHCLDAEDDADTWLRFYASEEERDAWSDESGSTPPPSEQPPFPRRMPRRPN